MIEYKASDRDDCIYIHDTYFEKVENGIPFGAVRPVHPHNGTGGPVLESLRAIALEDSRLRDTREVCRITQKDIEDAYYDNSILPTGTVDRVPVSISLLLYRLVSIENLSVLYRRLKTAIEKEFGGGIEFHHLIQLSNACFPDFMLPGEPIDSFEEIDEQKDRDEKNYELAVVYESAILPLIDQQKCTSLVDLWQEICDHDEEINTIWAAVVRECREEIRKLSTEYYSICQDDERLEDIIYNALTEIMNEVGNDYYSQAKVKASTNEFFVSSSMQETENRIQANPVYDFMDRIGCGDNWTGYLQTIREVVRRELAIIPTDNSYWEEDRKIGPNELWEFISCAVQMHILQCVEQGIEPSIIMRTKNKKATAEKHTKKVVTESDSSSDAIPYLLDKNCLSKLHELLDGQYGRALALRVECAMEAGLISAPKFPQLQKDFYAGGSGSGFNNYFKKGKFNDEEKIPIIEMMKH